MITLVCVLYKESSNLDNSHTQIEAGGLRVCHVVKENLFEGVNIANLFQSAKFFLPFPTIVPQDSLNNVGRYSE